MLHDEVLESNGFRQETIDGIPYMWIDTKIDQISLPMGPIPGPFDPLIRDRDRFDTLGLVLPIRSHIPAAKRERGYYALPLLWRDNVVGWVNASVINDRLILKIGYAHKAPRSKAYREALEEEASRMANFLRLPESEWELEESV